MVMSETDQSEVANTTDTRAKQRTVVSLFSGCGGMDLGFRGGFSFNSRYYDHLPFEIVWANDISASAAATYAANFPHPIREGDIAGLIDELPNHADVVLGGFPCQDVSVNGYKQVNEGKRTVLYEYVVEAIRRTNPCVFIAENVKGLLMSHGKPFFDKIMNDFSLPDYDVSYKLYLAADYEVPQMRERIFIVGMKGNRQFQHPEPIGRHMTAKEALLDLEHIPEDPALKHVWSKANRSPEQGNRRLVADKPATTIRAEHHGNAQWHYSLNRRISLREAARLQSFPDSFVFHGGMRETERQIGNAVPPVLAWHIARAVSEHIDT